MYTYVRRYVYMGFLYGRNIVCINEKRDYERETENMEQIINSSPLFLVVGLLIIGFVFLIKGADLFVEGSSSIAQKLKVPAIIIGLTIVAMGTSLPETAVSVTAALMNNNELALSNVIGSNIFNTMFVIGVCALFAPIWVHQDTLVRDIPFSVFCALLLAGLGYLGFGDADKMILGRLDGVIFLVLFAGYLMVMIYTAMRIRNEEHLKEKYEDTEQEEKMLSYPKCFLYIIGGAAAIAVGGDLTVDTASRIALDLGMSQTLVGLTIVSIGTSLPELVTSIVAAGKNEVDMAVGNAIGSNIFNILMVMGISSVVSPVSFLRENILDICILVGFSAVVWIIGVTRKRISRKEGILMIGMYLVYSGYIILR